MGFQRRARSSADPAKSRRWSSRSPSGSSPRRFQFREFIEQAWFITSVTLMPTILVSIPFGAVISLQVGNLTGQLGAQSFAGATRRARHGPRGGADRGGA